MRWLFLRFYFGVLCVLFLAWYIHGMVLKDRANAGRERVIATAHSGGARLIAQTLENASEEDRARALMKLQWGFRYPIRLKSIAELPSHVRTRLQGGEDVVCYSQRNGRELLIVAAMKNTDEAVSLGPLPDYTFKSIEDSIDGWSRMAVEQLRVDSSPSSVAKLQALFDIPIAIASKAELPEIAQRRLNYQTQAICYSPGNDRWFAATNLYAGDSIVRFGPFPSFESIEQKAAATTLALVLLPAALAIVFLIRPVASQLRQVENAARTIASGDLSARVDERRIGAARPLARAFNHMATRTETLVRTQRELLQAVSHELRTPLSRMRFAIDLIGSAKDDGERKLRLDALDAATEDLDQLVDELLRYVRMETAPTEIGKELVAVRETIDNLIPKYAAIRPSIAIHVDDPGDSTVLADRIGLVRVLGNLVSNACKHAKSSVAIGAHSNENSITIEVDDDGQGIPESDRERVFNPFVRLDNHTDSNDRGVGLGLALVQRIVTQHGGTVEIQTSPLGGCRVRTTWPRV